MSRPDKCSGCLWWYDDTDLCMKPEPCCEQEYVANPAIEKFAFFLLVLVLVYIFGVLCWGCGSFLVRNLIG